MKETRGERGDRSRWMRGVRRMEEEPQKTGVRKSRGPNGDEIFPYMSLFSRDSSGMGRPTVFYLSRRGGGFGKVLSCVPNWVWKGIS